MKPIEPTAYSKDYEITDAMFGAFRTPGGMPFFWKLLAWAALAYTIIYVVFGPMIVESYIDLLQVSIRVETTGEPEGLFTSLGTFFAKLVPLFFMAVFVQAAIRAAFFRGYFFGETEKTFPFGFGGDELRQFLAILGYYGVFIVVYLVGIFIVALISGVAMVAFGEAGGAAFILLMVIGMLALMVAVVYTMVALLPAGALTSIRGKTHVLAARHVTKDRFWALFGSVLVAGLIGYVVYYVLFFAGMMIGFAGIFDAEILSAMMLGDLEVTLEGLTQATETTGFKIGVILACAMMSAGAAFFSLMVAGPQAFYTMQWADALDDEA